MALLGLQPARRFAPSETPRQRSVLATTMQMTLDKKQIRAIFLFAFKTGSKAAWTTHDINNALGPETANECAVQWWFKKFCKGDKSLEDKEHSGWPLTMTN
eukprot:XP_011516390.1 histone-lysine N-methyltransferase SETMAR-like [Homo sapiens]